MPSRESLSEKLGNNVNERLINLVIGLLGGVLILAGILFCDFWGSKWETVIISVGASLVASAVVSYLSSIYIYKRKREKEITETWGLYSIDESRAQMNYFIGQNLENVTDHLDIIAYGLKSFRESKRKLINEKVKHGLEIRIITVNPNYEYLSQKDVDEKKLKDSTKESIKQLCRWIVELQKIKGSKVKIKFCKTLPTEVYFRVDDYIYTGPYQCGRESQRTITMEYRRPGKGFDYYKDYFDTLWNDVEFCNEDTTLLNL